MTDPATTPKKRRKGTSPTQRTLAYLRARGWLVGIVEKWNQHVRIRQDLFGCIDLIAAQPMRGVVGVQCCSATSGDGVTAHIRKINDEPRAVTWLLSGGQLWVFGWRQLAKRPGIRTTWHPRIVVGRVVDGAIEWTEHEELPQEGQDGR